MTAAQLPTACIRLAQLLLRCHQSRHTPTQSAKSKRDLLLCFYHSLHFFRCCAQVSVSKDETWLACACGEETKVVNRNTGVVQATIPSDTSAVLALAWHPSKAQLAVSTASLQVKLWDIDLLQTGTSGEDEIGAQMRTEPATDS
eukprot:SAG31_NODE_6789_length_1887_cov_3.646532_2_plen_144_part_00